MANGLNECNFLGNLGADPELKSTRGGQSLLKLRICVNESVRKGENWEDHSEWVNITVWGRRAESLGRILSKGDKIFVSGQMRTTSYEDRNGVKKYTTSINADKVILCGGRERRGETRSSSYDPEDQYPDEPSYDAPGF